MRRAALAIAIVDAAPIVAAADRGDPMRQVAQESFRASRDELVVPAPVTQEVDYLLGERVGRQAQQGFLASLAIGTFRVECLLMPEYRQVIALGEQYRDFNPGLADLSIIVLAARLNTRRIITFDQRHFRTMRPLQGGAFTLLPWDE